MLLHGQRLALLNAATIYNKQMKPVQADGVLSTGEFIPRVNICTSTLVSQSHLKAHKFLPCFLEDLEQSTQITMMQL